MSLAALASTLYRLFRSDLGARHEMQYCRPNSANCPPNASFAPSLTDFAFFLRFGHTTIDWVFPAAFPRSISHSPFQLIREIEIAILVKQGMFRRTKRQMPGHTQLHDCGLTIIRMWTYDSELFRVTTHFTQRLACYVREDAASPLVPVVVHRRDLRALG
jgi:hypothetical protein